MPVINGDDGVNELQGTAGSDTINGLGGVDTLSGLDGDDTLLGGEGNDSLEGGSGNDILDGGADFDAASYYDATHGVTVDLSLDTAQDTGWGLDRIVNVEALVGSAYDDVLTGSERDEIIAARAGNNVVHAMGGSDEVIAAYGRGTYDGGEGVDSISYVFNTSPVRVDLALAGPQRIAPGQVQTIVNFESLFGSIAGGDNLRGNENANSLLGFDGNDRMYGLGGNDLLNGGAGRDSLTGGLGDDLYVVDLATDRVVEAAGEGTDEVYSTIDFRLAEEVENLRLQGEAVRGTGNALANLIVGNAEDNRLNGLAGSDTMAGNDGDDLYYVDDAGDVVIEGSIGFDAVRASVDYTLADNVETLSLIGSARVGTGNALANTLFGAGGGDTLTGLLGDDILRGKNARDTLDGGVGDDLLDGGQGKDTMTGGDGQDTFQFRDGDFGGTRAVADVITDFDQLANEKLRLNLVDADTTQAGNQAFAWIGNGAFTGVAGQLHYVQQGGNTYVEGDLDGDSVADIFIALTGTINLAATARATGSTAATGTTCSTAGSARTR